MAVPGLDMRYQSRCEDAGYIASFHFGKELSLIVWLQGPQLYHERFHSTSERMCVGRTCSKYQMTCALFKHKL